MPLAARPPVPCRVPASRAAEACPSRLSQTLLTCADESAIPESLARASRRHVVVLPLRAITLGVLSEGVRTMPELVSDNHRVTARRHRSKSIILIPRCLRHPPRSVRRPYPSLRPSVPPSLRRSVASSLRRCPLSLRPSFLPSKCHRRVTTKKLYSPNEAISRPDCPKRSETVHRPAHADPPGNGGQCGHAYAHEAG